MKSTKKSLFITTIAMVVLMVVALSTATFAWYVSSDAVSAETTTVSTATTNSANIAIGWTQDATSTTVSFVDSAKLQPMAPQIKFGEGTQIADAKFYTAVQSINEAGTKVFSQDGTSANPWTQKEKDGTAETLYILNYNTLTAVDVKITMTVENVVVAEKPDLLVADYFHLAVFANDEYVGLLGTNDASYGFIEKEQSGLVTEADGTTLVADKIATSTELTISVPAATVSAAGFTKISLFGWIDGVNLTNALAGGAVTFDLAINAVAPAQQG